VPAACRPACSLTILWSSASSPAMRARIVSLCSPKPEVSPNRAPTSPKVAPRPRSPSGYRDYRTSAVRVLRCVKRAQEPGFTLADIEELLTLPDGGPRSCDRARTRAGSQIVELDRKIADLHRIGASLAELVATCEPPRADRSCPLLQAIDTDDALTEVSR
jgi:MerR family transcriptional regulator, mercuric resistance operon regulatory protein